MADQLQLRGGTTAETATFTGALREVTVDTDKDTLVVHDNALAGGYPLLRQDLSNLPAGTIDNADINASAAIVDTKLDTIATAGKVSNSATTATDANTASAIVARDASGNFTAGTITAALTGAASSNVLKAGDTMTGALVVPLASAATPSLTFTGDLNTGIYSPGADQVAVATNGVERVEFGTTEVVFNDGGANYDFRIEGDTNANLFFVDASAEAVGIGTTSPSKKLEIANGDIRLADGYTISWGDDTYRIFRNGSQLRFDTNGSQALTIDSSGRLLVGTSSWSSGARAVVAGNITVPTGNGVLVLSRGSSSAQVAGDPISNIEFTNSSAATFARISVEADGTTGTTTDLPGRLLFWTTADGASSPTERMRITNGGDLFSLNADNGIVSRSTLSAGTANTIFTGQHSATSIISGTNCFKVYTNGNVENTNNSYGSLSDIKLKENVVDANSQWDDLKALQVRNYNLKEGQTHTQIGLVAQEVELVSPGLVSESPDRDEDGNDLGTVTKSVNYSVLYMKAVKALQEAMERIEALEADVAQLKGA
jgi:hypothetical protein